MISGVCGGSGTSTLLELVILAICSSNHCRRQMTVCEEEGEGIEPTVLCGGSSHCTVSLRNDSVRCRVEEPSCRASP